MRPQARSGKFAGVISVRGHKVAIYLSGKGLISVLFFSGWARGGSAWGWPLSANAQATLLYGRAAGMILAAVFRKEARRHSYVGCR